MKQRNYCGDFVLWFGDQSKETQQKELDKIDDFLREHKSPKIEDKTA